MLRPSEFATQTAPSPNATSTGPSPTGIVRQGGCLAAPRDLDARHGVVALVGDPERVGPDRDRGGSLADVDRALLLDRDGIDLDDRVRVAIDDPQRLEPECDIGECGEDRARAGDEICLEADVPALIRPNVEASERRGLADEPDGANADGDARPRRPAARSIPAERGARRPGLVRVRVDPNELGQRPEGDPDGAGTDRNVARIAADGNRVGSGRRIRGIDAGDRLVPDVGRPDGSLADRDRLRVDGRRSPRRRARSRRDRSRRPSRVRSTRAHSSRRRSAKPSAAAIAASPSAAAPARSSRRRDVCFVAAGGASPSRSAERVAASSSPAER